MSSLRFSRIARISAMVLSVVLVFGLLYTSMFYGTMSGMTTRVQSSSTVAPASTSAMDLNPFSSSSSGKLFKMKKVRTYTGPRLFSIEGRGSHRNKSLDEPKGLAPPDGIVCDKWAVVTTIFEPTDTVREIVSLKDWCMVVVGDKKSPPDYWVPKEERGKPAGANSKGKRTPENLVYLSAKDQERLPYSIVPHLRWNHFGRKNIGFVYAIHHGAKVIYDVDDDNTLLDPAKGPPDHLFNVINKVFDNDGKRRTDNEIDRGDDVKLVWTPSEHHVYNPYPYYDPRSAGNYSEFVWPRGFPLEFVKDRRTFDADNLERHSRKKQSGTSRISIIQSLANHDPDVDAIYRMTRRLPVEFERQGVVMAVPPGVFAPMNAQAALYSREAFWGMLLPVTVHGRVSDIWRSYFTERIMWDAGQSMSFASPFAEQYRNPHSYLADFESETPLYLQAGALTSFLCRWTSNEKTIEGKLEQLIITLYEYGVLGIEDINVNQAFLSDLADMNYEFPAIGDSVWTGREPITAEAVDDRRSSSD